MPKIVLTSEDIDRLKPESLSDILSLFRTRSPQDLSLEADFDKFDMTEVVSLTLDQVEGLIAGINEKTIDGLKIFAEQGPIIDARLLNDVGITNYGAFQGGITKRTRTVTRNRHAFLFSWDEWAWDDETLVSGRYAVTPKTWTALRLYFGVRVEELV